MKTSIKIFIVMLLSTILLQAGAFEKVADSKAVKVTMSSEKPLTTGDNTIKLNITDVKYENAKVSVKVFMPAMPGMPAMEHKADAKNLGNGHYEVDVNFSMSGTWQIHIFVAPKTGKKVRVKSSVNI